MTRTQAEHRAGLGTKEVLWRAIVRKQYPYAYQDAKGSIWTDDFYNCDSHCVSVIENVEIGWNSIRERFSLNWQLAALEVRR